MPPFPAAKLDTEPEGTAKRRYWLLLSDSDAIYAGTALNGKPSSAVPADHFFDTFFRVKDSLSN